MNVEISKGIFLKSDGRNYIIGTYEDVTNKETGETKETFKGDGQFFGTIERALEHYAERKLEKTDAKNLKELKQAIKEYKEEIRTLIKEVVGG